MIIGAIHLEGNTALAAALLLGALLGAVFIRARLADRDAVENALLLRDGKILPLLLGVMLLGVLAGGWFPSARPEGGGLLWSSLAGGVIAGIGLFLTGLTPGTALAALGRGRFYVLWLLAGGALAISAGKAVAEFFRAHLQSLDVSLPGGDPATAPWNPESPRLYLGLALLILLALVCFTVGSRGDGAGSAEKAPAARRKSKPKGKK